MPRSLRILALLLTVLAGAAAAPAAAGAASRFVIRGAGWGHGVGMSQWGAYGMALNGWDHARILGHFYTGTELGRTDPAQPVRVLLASRSGPRRFTGASEVGGRRVRALETYTLRPRADGTFALIGPRGRRAAVLPAPLRLSGPGAVTLEGVGTYRGALTLNRIGRRYDVVNTVGLDDYVRGVVARESPSTWPSEALQAQAVAARTYAITTTKGAATFDHYADTRSQVYGGVAAETPTTDAAVAATGGQVVTYGGQPVVTYFFSTSGGRTEGNENSFGGTPLPWLRSVEDPYDDASPHHRWDPATMPLKQAGRRLGDLVQGRFRGIDVVRRGGSPRIVEADVIGSRGRTRVSGSTLRARLGLRDTWAYFTSITTDAKRKRPGRMVPAHRLDRTGGAEVPVRLAFAQPLATVSGRVLPAGAGAVATVERRAGDGRWRAVRRVRLGAGGRFRIDAWRAGAYRVRVAAVTGPAVRVR